MTRALVALVLTAATAAGAIRAQTPAGASSPDRLLHIQAVALDGKGNPVTDLKREDFEVWINGFRIPIESLAQAFINTNDLNGAVDRILRESNDYYVIGVADPPVGRASAIRELEVRALRCGVTIRARRMIPSLISERRRAVVLQRA